MGILITFSRGGEAKSQLLINGENALGCFDLESTAKLSFEVGVTVFWTKK